MLKLYISVSSLSSVPLRQVLLEFNGFHQKKKKKILKYNHVKEYSVEKVTKGSDGRW